MEGKTTIIFYKDLTQEEKDMLNDRQRKQMIKSREEFINNPLYKDINPEDVWYLRLNYIKNWKYPDYAVLFRCECGSLDFDCLKDTMFSNDIGKACLFKCCKCGKTHWEYD